MKPNGVVKFGSQSKIRQNFWNIAGISEQQELLHAEDRERIPAGYGRVYFGGNNSLTESGLSDVNNPVNCCVDGYCEDGKLGDGNIDMPKLQKQEHECEECRDLHELGDIIAEVDEYFCALPDKEYFKCLNVKPAIDANQNKDLEKINITCPHRCGYLFRVQYGLSSGTGTHCCPELHRSDYVYSPCFYDNGIGNTSYDKINYYLKKAIEDYQEPFLGNFDEIKNCYYEKIYAGTGYRCWGSLNHDCSNCHCAPDDTCGMEVSGYASKRREPHPHPAACEAPVADYTTLSTAKDTGLFYYICQNRGYYQYIKCVHASDQKGRRYIFKGGMTNRRGELVIMVQLQGHGVAEIRVEDGLLIDIYK